MTDLELILTSSQELIQIVLFINTRISDISLYEFISYSITIPAIGVECLLIRRIVSFFSTFMSLKLNEINDLDCNLLQTIAYQDVNVLTRTISHHFRASDESRFHMRISYTIWSMKMKRVRD